MKYKLNLDDCETQSITELKTNKTVVTKNIYLRDTVISHTSV